VAYNTGYISIPIELCKYALTNHKVNQVKLFVYLKTICCGHFKLTDELIIKTCTDLGYKSKKTFYANISWLIRNKWITINSKSCSYRLVGLVQLSFKLGFHSVKGALFDPPIFSEFKPFLAAAVITYLMAYKSRIERLSEQKLGSSSKSSRSPAFYTLPHAYLAGALDVPRSVAANYRYLAVKAKYIAVEHQFEKLNIPLSEKHLYKKYNTTRPETIRVRNKELYRQLPDRLISCIFLRTRQNFKITRKKRRGKFLYR
jgi:hypothetical protein